MNILETGLHKLNGDRLISSNRFAVVRSFELHKGCNNLVSGMKRGIEYSFYKVSSNS